ncbi:hypothetical protein [Streptomyces abyssomicinicus]|uniref:hypothetical protein n=1 Tax=Streptomyces abyssomicinicus TaxID=574929 RepID=UPI0012504551|nr:hypothetical protein [Streptomyces abyssomicinicus]
MHGRHTRGALILSLATAAASSLALVGLTAGPAQALPKACETSLGRISNGVTVSCEGGTGYFKVWARCDNLDPKLPGRTVLGEWVKTDSRDTVYCPAGSLVSDGGYYVTEIPIGTTS